VDKPVGTVLSVVEDLPYEVEVLVLLVPLGRRRSIGRCFCHGCFDFALELDLIGFYGLESG
jgi:hypothetical protein